MHRLQYRVRLETLPTPSFLQAAPAASGVAALERQHAGLFGNLFANSGHATSCGWCSCAGGAVLLALIGQTLSDVSMSERSAA
jgi:hypothetical protein